MAWQREHGCQCGSEKQKKKNELRFEEQRATALQIRSPAKHPPKYNGPARGEDDFLYDVLDVLPVQNDGRGCSRVIVTGRM
jgi:hypothetical protein